MTDEDLVKNLNVAADLHNGRCRYVIDNACPPDWNVEIVSAGVNFYYADNTSDVDGPRPVRLKSGQSAIFWSGKADGCVKRCFVAMAVHVPGEGNNNLTKMGDDAGEKGCWVSGGATLGQQRLVDEADLMKREIRLEIISR